LAEEIQDRLHLTSHLVVGHSGAFNVKLGDEILFSKSKLRRFPEPGEISEVLEQRLSSGPTV
jgi:hypothetical protein